MAGLKWVLLIAVLLLIGLSAQAAVLQTQDQYQWLQQIENEAVEQGITPDIVHEALDNFAPNSRVVELDQKQPEGTVTFAVYRHNTVTAARVKKGAELMQRYAAQLTEIEDRTGVSPQIVVALWGIESSFGQNMGGFETISSLATLAYEGRRADFFKSELFAALHILQEEHMRPNELRGSWAGALGQCQFMPSTYLKYAVDGDGNGRRDIWNDTIDVLASIANYLAAEGWRGDLTWGRAVNADAVNDSNIGADKIHSLAEWTQMGVTNPDGSSLPQRDLQAAVIKPDGDDGPAFLIYDNARALLRWNRSTYFMLAVGLMADDIKRY